MRFSNPDPLRLIREHGLKKGDVLAVARLAGIQAVKRTSEIIPLAHSGVGVEGCIVKVYPVPPSSTFNDIPKADETSYEAEARAINDTGLSSDHATFDEALQIDEPVGICGGIRLFVSVETTAKTGVEMEALTGVMGAALTVVDMCKGVDKWCIIDNVKVLGKKGGRNDWGRIQSSHVE